jgi:hypothetical protein
MRIDVLPDDVLLEIFNFYVDMEPSSPRNLRVEEWKSLINVCRRWRTLVFRSPRRLNLRLGCTPGKPAKDTLDIWPTLPLVVHSDGHKLAYGMDNIIAALGQSTRVCQVAFYGLDDFELEEILPAMRVPFPELTDLHLGSDLSNGGLTPVIPDSFLDGSAPRLRHFGLYGIPYPGLQNLLFSATHLVSLELSNIPHSGYISPEAIVALISVLSSLEGLAVKFRSPQSCPDRETRRPHPSKRSVIPALTSLRFKGVIEYLEDLVTGIDTPQLDGLGIKFFNQIDFDTLRLAQFINRTPKLIKRGASVLFYDDLAHLELTHELSPGYTFIRILCSEPDWQLSSIEQVCNSFFHPLSTVEVLYISHHYSERVWKDDAIENNLWFQLLLPFTAVKNLYLNKKSAPRVAAALQELVGVGITVVLPRLENIFVRGLEPSGPFQKNIGQFLAARQLSDHPITISNWDGNRKRM